MMSTVISNTSSYREKMQVFTVKDSMKNEQGGKSEDNEITTLKATEASLFEELKEINKEKFRLEVEETSWDQVLTTKTEELKTMEEKLDEKHQEIWSRREEFCLRVDVFIQELEEYWMRWRNEMRCGRVEVESEIEREIAQLEAEVVEEGKIRVELDRRLEEVELEKERALRMLEDDSELKRLEECVRVGEDRCAALKARISESKTQRPRIPTSQLFSMVNLEDVKKLSPYAAARK